MLKKILSLAGLVGIMLLMTGVVAAAAPPPVQPTFTLVNGQIGRAHV